MSHSSIHVSPGVAQFFHIISGMPWPESDEGLLRDVRDDYLALAEDLPKLSEYILDAVQTCDKRMEGEAAKAFRKEWGQFVNTDQTQDPLRKAAELCTQLSELAGKVANTVEYTKWMAIGQLVQLLIEIAFAIAWSVFTGGFSLVQLEWQKILTRQFLLQLLKKLAQLIAMHTFGGIVGGLILDAIIQGIQFNHGDRHEWDKDLTKQAAIFGAISGAIGGPLSLIGEGLGKLIGPRLAKLFVESALNDVIKGLTGIGLKGAGKELGEGAAAGALKGTAKDLAESVAGGALKGAGKDLGEGTAAGALKGAGKGSGKEAGQGLGHLLGDEAAEKFARGISNLLKENAQYLAKGFKAGRKVGAATGEKFVRELGELFEKELGQELGSKFAREMGEHLGRQFAEHSLKTVMKESSKEAIKETLENLAKDGGRAALTPELKLLVEKMPELAGGVNKMNKMFHLGHVLGSQFESGINQYLTEGIYNTIYNGEWQASGMSFLGGFMMGGMRHMIMGLASPLTLRYADFVRGLESSRITEESGPNYPMTHPLTFLSVISNMGGHSAPFPVPRRPGHIDQINAPRLSGGDGAPLRSDGASLSGSSVLAGNHHREENGDGVLADPKGKTSHDSSVDGGSGPKAPAPKVATESGAKSPVTGPTAETPKPTGKRDTDPGPATRTRTETDTPQKAENPPKAGTPQKTGGRGGETATADSQGGATKAQHQSPPGQDRRTTVRDEHDEPVAHERTTATDGGPAGPPGRQTTGNGSAAPHPDNGPQPHKDVPGAGPAAPVRTSSDDAGGVRNDGNGSGNGSGNAHGNGDSPAPGRPDPKNPDPKNSDPQRPDPQGPVPPATPPRDPRPDGPTDPKGPHDPSTPGPGPSAPTTSHTPSGHTYHRVDAPEHAKVPAGDERRTTWHDKQQEIAERHDAVLAEAEAKEALHGAIEEHLIEGHADLPRDLRALTGPGTEAWRRTATDLQTDIEARPHEREEILAGAADRLELAGARELALRVAVSRFDHLLTERGLDPAATGGDHPLAEIRREASEHFRSDAERDIAQVYATRADVTPERNALAARALENRLRRAAGDLDVRQARATQTERIERAVEDAHADWKRENLTETDRALLDAVGVPKDARVSEEARDQVAEAMRERLAEFHGRYQDRTTLHVDEAEPGAGRRDEDTFLAIRDENGDDLAALDPTPRGKDRLEADFRDVFESHKGGLSHDFTVQAVRETVLQRSIDAVKDAADAWKTSAPDQFGSDTLAKLGLADGPSPRAVATARADLARRTDRLVTEHTAADRDPARLKEELDRLTSPAAVNRLLALHGAREKALSAAEETARTKVPHDLGDPDATDHRTDPAATVETALGRPARGSRTDAPEPPASAAARRVREGYTERVRAAFEENFRSLLRDPGADHKAGLTEQLKQWHSERERLTEGLEQHVAFERAVLPAREHAAAGYDRLAEGRRVSEEAVQELKTRYGGEFFDAYKDHWGPEDLDGERWRGHEAANENVFGRRPAEEQAKAETDHRPEAEAEPEHKPETESTPEHKPETEPEPTPEHKPETEPSPDHKPETEPTPVPGPLTPSGPLVRPRDTVREQPSGTKPGGDRPEGHELVEQGDRRPDTPAPEDHRPATVGPLQEQERRTLLTTRQDHEATGPRRDEQEQVHQEPARKEREAAQETVHPVAQRTPAKSPHSDSDDDWSTGGTDDESSAPRNAAAQITQATQAVHLTETEPETPPVTQPQPEPEAQPEIEQGSVLDLPVEPLPAGSFEAAQLWRTRDRLPEFHIQDHTLITWPREGDTSGLPEAPDVLFQHAVDLIETRLQSILDRAEDVIHDPQARNDDRDAAQVLLDTHAVLAGDGWSPAYISEFLHLQMRLRASTVPNLFPERLFEQNPQPLEGGGYSGFRMLTAYEFPDGPIPREHDGGSLRGSNGAADAFYTWLEDEAGGHPGYIADWEGTQGGGSWEGSPLSAKLMFAHFRPGDGVEAEYLLRNLGSAHDIVYRQDYVRSMVAQHVFTHEFLKKTELPNVDRATGQVALFRLESQRHIDNITGSEDRQQGRPMPLLRGPAESFSLLSPFKEPHSTSDSGPFYVTVQTVPIHRVFGTHLQGRYENLNSPIFGGEDEFVVMSAGREIIFNGMTVPLTPRQRAEEQQAAQNAQNAQNAQPVQPAQAPAAPAVVTPPAQVPGPAVPPVAPHAVLPASAWADIRTSAPPARMETERFDPLVRGQAGPGDIAGPGVRDQYENRQPSLGGLHGAETAISYDVRRFEAQPGHWVTEFTLNLHLQGPDGRPLPTHEATRMLDRVRAVVDERFNERFRLPGGDQVHLRVDGTQNEAGAHRAITVVPGRDRSDQLTWYDESPPGVLLHEVLHFLGLPDEYVERAATPGDAFALRRRDRWAGEDGVMGTSAHRDDFTVLPRHLERIEEVLRSGPVVRDLTFAQYRSGSTVPTAPAPHAPGTGAVAPAPPRTPA
ncbi:hypothetical protein ACFV04_14760, partial [Kitasatospora sp. NPDC059599]